jgi:hypothetical protein
MRSAETVLSYAVRLAVDWDWTLITLSRVAAGIVEMDPATQIMCVHPNARLHTLAMNAGAAFNSNAKVKA